MVTENFVLSHQRIDACIKKLIWCPGKTRDYSYKKQKGKLNQKKITSFSNPCLLITYTQKLKS